MQAHFSSQTLAEIFRDLYRSERSGVLSLVRDEVEKRIFFHCGLIYFAESTEEQERLGPRLVADRRLSGGALAEAERNISHPGELAQALINRELIGKQALSDTVASIVNDVVPSVFAWDRGAAEFREAEPLPVMFDCDVLSTFEVILRGIFAMSGFERIQEAMLDLDNRLRISKPTPVPLERLTLSPAHGFVLSRVDGTTTVKEVLSQLPQGEEELTLKFLFGLLVMGVLQFDPKLGDGPFRVGNILRDHADRQALEQMQEQTILQALKQMNVQNPYQVLGVASNATPQTVERAYEEAKALFSRDRILPRIRDQFRSQLAVIESRLIEAYLTLTQPDRRETRNVTSGNGDQKSDDEIGVDDLLVRVEMDKTKSKLAIEEAARVADSYYGKALQAAREGDFHNCIQYLKLAISYNAKDARLYYMLADCQVRNPEPRWQHMAEQNYSKATELDPWKADYWISLGRFYKKRGLKLRARKQFEEALKLVPNHDEASEELASLGK